MCLKTDLYRNFMMKATLKKTFNEDLFTLKFTDLDFSYQVPRKKKNTSCEKNNFVTLNKNGTIFPAVDTIKIERVKKAVLILFLGLNFWK